MRGIFPMMSGAALGFIAGAGYMMMPQSRPLRKAMGSAVSQMKRKLGKCPFC